MLLKVENNLKGIFFVLRPKIAELADGDEQRISRVAVACSYQAANP
jgi:hypothetical protein